MYLAQAITSQRELISHRSHAVLTSDHGVSDEMIFK